MSTRAQQFQLSDGANIVVKVLGDGPGKPLLIVHHGAPGLSTHTEPEASFGFLADTFRIIVYDARGSGASDLQPPYTHARCLQWVADIEELRIWAGADSFVLAGGSYGGFVALEYAIHHPDKLNGLILRDTWANGPEGVRRVLHTVLTSPRIHPDRARQRRMWAGKALDNEDFRAGFAEIQPLYAPSSDGSAGYPPGKGFAAELMFHYATHNVAFSENLPKFDVRHQLGNITVPTLVVVGRHDMVAPVEFSEEIHRGIPGSELTIFENSGHSPPSDETEAFQARVRGFVAGLDL
ncbi:alpha/beta hydrolase fold protein [Mycena crocata]|nr:alpha/beta hydrolase fold protein [Mycena crocata]